MDEADKSKGDAARPPEAAGLTELRVRPADAADLGQIIAIDAQVTGLKKTDYWYELFHRYGAGRNRQASSRGHSVEVRNAHREAVHRTHIKRRARAVGVHCLSEHSPR